MRKNNDGYVLPFVLVVMFVLTIISASLMTAAYRNLKLEQDLTERMKEKYKVEGKIEKIVAQLECLTELTGTSEDVKEVLSEKLKELCGSDVEFVKKNDESILAEQTEGEEDSADSGGDSEKPEGEEFEYEFVLTSTSTYDRIVTSEAGKKEVQTVKTQVQTTIALIGEATAEQSGAMPDLSGSNPVKSYKIDNLELTYKTYEISTEISTKEVPGE